MKERDNITTWLFNIGQHVKAVLDKKSAMDTNLEYLLANKERAKANKDFKYPDEEVKIIEDPVPHNKYTTYCPKCVSTCHKKCGIKDDGEKYNCWAMKVGYCTQCKHKCKWDIHTNKPFIIKKRKWQKNIIWHKKRHWNMLILLMGKRKKLRI